VPLEREVLPDRAEARQEGLRDLVQIDGLCAIALIAMDTLSIAKDSIPDRESSDVLKRKSG
jgi:hypothetical protein